MFFLHRWRANVKQYWHGSFYDDEYEQHYLPSGLENKRDSLKRKSQADTLSGEDKVWYLISSKRVNPYHNFSEMGPVPRWLLEVSLFVPGIIIYPLLKTVADYTSRTHSVLFDLDEKWDAFFNNEDGFKRLIAEIGDDPFWYQSLESQNLVRSLNELALIETLQPYVDGYLIYMKKAREDFERDAAKRGIVNIVYPEPSYINIKEEAYLNTLTSEAATASKANAKSNCRNNQITLIKKYINQPENKGAKLLQFIEANLLRAAEPDETRKKNLLTKVRLEITRLEKRHVFFAEAKLRSMKAYILNDTIEKEDELRKIISVPRYFSLFSKPPKSYNNVYGYDSISASPPETNSTHTPLSETDNHNTILNQR